MTSYLACIADYKSMYEEKRAEFRRIQERMDNGLLKLLEAVDCVKHMNSVLEGKEKVLTIHTDEVNSIRSRVRNYIDYIFPTNYHCLLV